jgi:hypothetical protein
MCTELLPPGGYPIAVKYITYHITLYWNNTVSSAKKARRTGKLQQKDLLVKNETLANVNFLLKVQNF